MAKRTNNSSETKVVIFDFDGTLADVVEILRTLYVNEAKVRGWPELTEEAYVKLRGGTVAEAVKWVGIKPWQIPGLLRSGRKKFYSHSKEIKLFVGISELLKGLSKDGWYIYILSANSSTTIKEVLARHKLDKLVTVLKRPALFGKASSINALINSKGYEKHQVWMVGDEVRDIEAANKVGIPSIAVSWGLQDEVALKRHNPTYVAHKPIEIEQILKQG
jgi:phosphoglycolate phosphatase